MHMKAMNFTQRHIGPRQKDINEMLSEVGCSSIDELVDNTIPSDIRLQRELSVSKAMSEQEYLAHILYWNGLLWNACAFCDIEKRFRKSRVVYSIYAISSRDFSR